MTPATSKSEQKLLLEAKQATDRAKKLERSLVLEIRKKLALQRQLTESARQLRILKEQITRLQTDNKLLKERTTVYD